MMIVKAKVLTLAMMLLATVAQAQMTDAQRQAIVGHIVDNMVYVEGGVFTMGATKEQGDDANNDERPAHKVTLSSFRICRFEVTQREWRAVMGGNPSHFNSDNRPVECVSWEGCQQFIDKLNSMTGLRFRLPTEAEWEYAARGGSLSHGFKYSGSSNIGDVAWCKVNAERTTHRVGMKQPNELGLYDMSGNVCEWCQDWWETGRYASSEQTNPVGKVPTPDPGRVRRGGCWDEYAYDCRVSSRYASSPSRTGAIIGFRLAL